MLVALPKIHLVIYHRVDFAVSSFSVELPIFICSLVSLCDPPGTNSDLLSIHDLCLQLC